MASGIIDGGDYNNRYSYYIEWRSHSNSSSANSSELTVDWIYQKKASDPYNGHNNTDSTKIKFNIAGEDTDLAVAHFDLRSAAIGTKQVLRSYTKTIYHENDGSKQVSIGGTHIPGNSWPTVTISPQTITLDSIPRYANITKFELSSELESIKVDWETDATCDRLQYSLNESDWINIEGNPFIIRNLSPNQEYSVKIKVRRQDSQLWSQTSAKEIITQDIARIISAPDNISFGDNINLVKTNPSKIYNIVKIQTINPIETIYILESPPENMVIHLKDIEWMALYKKLGDLNSMSIRYLVETIGDNTYTDYVDKTITLTGNIKTIYLKKNNNWKRSLVWIKNNGLWKKGIIWYKSNNIWKRCI